MQYIKTSKNNYYNIQNIDIVNRYIIVKIIAQIGS